ncbi:MAG: J domain-containing protein [Polyangiaceae bacterium]
MSESSTEYLFAWLEVLDELTYYELFGIAADADADTVRTAFHAFCDTFHPDRHVGFAAREHDAATAIFKRGTEAYVVLSDVGLRHQYDEQLSVQPSPRPPRIAISRLSHPPSTRATAHAALEDTVRSPSARPFARRAEELVLKGDFRQAKLQLVLANHMDPGNAALEGALKDVEDKLGSRK